jgi:putative DNA primase/helicase
MTIPKICDEILASAGRLHVVRPAGASGSTTAFSDIALATDFADDNLDLLRFVPLMGKWFVWDGKRWELDVRLLARERAKETCRKAATQCNKSKMAKLIASARTISSVERLGQCDQRIVGLADQWDRDPWLLNTPAGTIDLHTGEMRPHNPTDYITKLTGVSPDLAMPTPIWDAFLERITNGDTELIEYLQRMAGYCLTGTTNEHALFFLWGKGANGKSTFLKALITILGDYHQATPIETFTASNQDRHPTELADLHSARMVTSVETEEGRRWAESRIKQLTGGDQVKARFMRQDFFKFMPQFKLVIAGNHKPGLRSVDEAIRRRVNLVPFAVTIPPGERDIAFNEKLEPELPGVLAWMIRGCAAWQEERLNPPSSVTEATDNYLAEEDAIAAWMEEHCDFHPQSWTNTTRLFRSWSEWATAAGEYVGSMKRFSQNLENRPRLTRRRDRTEGAGFTGLALRL